MSSLFPQLTVIGITGKIGSGKSTVAHFLENHGAFRLDCDQIVHDLYKPGGLGSKKIHTFLGEPYMRRDGSVNREKLLKELFKHPKKWQVLNRMIHPLVAEMLRRELRKIPNPSSGGEIWVALEIPIFDARLFGPFIDALWVIESSEDIRVDRLRDRSLTRHEIEQISHQQSDQYDFPHVVLPNEGDLSELEIRIQNLLENKF